MLARNTIWNLSGNAASIVIALLSVPILLRYLGADRLGVISLIWIVEGQFGIFDLGLSQALTKLIAEKLGVAQEDETAPIFWATLAIMATLGVIGSILLWVLSPWIVYSALNVPKIIQGETLAAFHFVAISLPAVISSAALKGTLAAHQRFDLLNMTRVPISIASYLAPLLVLPISQSLAPVVLVLVASRLLAWAIHFILCLRISPTLYRNITTEHAPVRRMFSFGGWMSVTNIVGPVMVNLDRIMIGSLLSMKAVAQYATPYEAATKLWIVPSSLTAVLFPAFSAALTHDRQRAALLFEKGLKYIFLCMFPIALVLITLGRWGIGIWLGHEFMEHSTTVFQLLVFGVFVNSLAQLPFWQIQAAGRPDLAAKAHLIELPCYLLLFWKLTTSYGITGAGVAWVMRTTADTIIMFVMSGRLIPEGKVTSRQIVWAICASLTLLAAGLTTHLITAIIFLLISATGFGITAWRLLLTAEEKTMVRDPLGFLAGRKQLKLDRTPA